MADQYYSGGEFGVVTDAISGTKDEPVYQTERWGDFSYNIPVANGRYDVTLQFSELAFYSPDERVFSVTAEGLPIIQGFDIFETVGAKTSTDKSFSNIEVKDGVLNLHFWASSDQASVTGIVVKSAGKIVDSTNGGVISGIGDLVDSLVAPAGLRSSNLSNRQIAVSWNGNGANSGVTQYKIFRNGVLLAAVPNSGAASLSYTDTGLEPDTLYSYTVKAFDATDKASPSSSTLSAKTLVVAGQVTLAWGEPTERANGEKLYKTDIGGYQIRYKLPSATSYTVVNVLPGVTSYSFSNLVGDYIFEIATYDTNNVFSQFVRASTK